MKMKENEIYPFSLSRLYVGWRRNAVFFHLIGRVRMQVIGQEYRPAPFHCLAVFGWVLGLNAGQIAKVSPRVQRKAIL